MKQNNPGWIATARYLRTENGLIQEAEAVRTVAAPLSHRSMEAIWAAFEAGTPEGYNLDGISYTRRCPLMPLVRGDHRSVALPCTKAEGHDGRCRVVV